jgi:hypothetical protein
MLLLNASYFVSTNIRLQPVFFLATCDEGKITEFAIRTTKQRRKLVAN